MSPPIAPNETKEDRAKNRRVELMFYEIFSSSESYDLVEDMRKIKIKVLSGDGNLDSAKEMARKLGSIGYKIEFIDHAPKSSFRRNTVFFAPEVQQEAKRLESGLGGNTIVNPLSWYSIFDLIIVTVKNRPDDRYQKIKTQPFFVPLPRFIRQRPELLIAKKLISDH